MRLDLNCDLGEGAPHDAELMPLISSANIACGAHAGDATTMRRTLELARQQGVAPGAHPGYRDRANFGRRELALAPGEVFQLVAEQIRALQQVAAELGIELTHVKPHGALYNQAARDLALADAVAAAVQSVNARLILFGLAGSALITAARACRLAVAEEVFADRRYQADGALVPRSRPDALITDPAEACAQVMHFLREGHAQTVCVHGDGPQAVTFARRLRSALHQAQIEIKPCDP
jgi:5-oxoprolinase (ATP-hydrolysing) subunit A